MVLLLIGGGLLFGALIMGMVSLHRFYDDPDTSLPVNKSYLLRLLASRDLPRARRTLLPLGISGRISNGTSSCTGS